MNDLKIRIAGTVNDSIVDGPGIRYTVFVQGCPHHCEGCHNPQTHSFDGGTLSDTDDIFSKISENPLLDGVTFSGGEPFCQAEELAELGKKVKSLGLNVITYTGYDFEYLYIHRNENGFGKLLDVTDYLIDGRFILEQKDWNIKFRGSRNQRYLDCTKSMIEGRSVEVEPE